MPIYEYRCRQCGERFETFQAIAETADEAKCPKCDSQNLIRIISPFFGKNAVGESCGPTFHT